MGKARILSFVMMASLMSLAIAVASVPAIPAHALGLQPNGFIEISTIDGKNVVNSYSTIIVIKNNSDTKLESVRIMLSPEISKNFKLSDSAIKSIGPNSNVTITFELYGNPKRDMVGNLVGYKGELIVMAEHLSPVTMPVNIGAEESDHLSSYMDKVASMAEQRYNKISLLNSILLKQPKMQYNYEVTISNKDNVITSPSDELVIRNLSDKELKNVRIYLSNAGHAFLLEQKNIQYLEPNGQISIKLIPTIDMKKYSPKDIKGELLIVPSNDNPIQIRINIAGQEGKDSADEFDVMTISGNNAITTGVDRLSIKNLGDRAMGSVKIILSNNLDRIFSLSQGSFQRIDLGKEVTIEFRYNAGDLRTFMQDYKGELTIVSEHHNLKSIPISIEWKKVESKHFTVYARSGDEEIARQLTDFLEANYPKITSRFGEMSTKTVIYMAASMDEIKLVNPSGHPYYSYVDDRIFVCACDDPKYNAMKEFVYRLIINNYPSYSNINKFIFDKENWLLDGVTSYIAADITDTGMTRKYSDAFTSNTSFQWYGYGSLEQYGAAYTFFEYLESKYGSKVIDKTLHYLGAGMISNHRCDTIENCALLQAVYNVSGLDLDNKRYTLSFKNLVQEWEEYVDITSITGDEDTYV